MKQYGINSDPDPSENQDSNLTNMVGMRNTTSSHMKRVLKAVGVGISPTSSYCYKYFREQFCDRTSGFLNPFIHMDLSWRTREVFNQSVN